MSRETPEAVFEHARAAMKRGLAAVSNLSAFLGALEGYCRRVWGGGSISSRLFQQETLTHVVHQAHHVVPIPAATRRSG